MQDVTPFLIDVPDEALLDLRARLRNTRWPIEAPGEPWELGTDARFMRGLTEYWVDGFDWRAAEASLNLLSAVHDGDRRHAHPLRPSACSRRQWHPDRPDPRLAERLHRVPARPRPAAEGFDVVVPSLPGYGFSERPQVTGVNYRHVARIWRELMHRLGYERFGVGGGDFGAGVASLLALDYPESVIGVHLTNFEMLPTAEEAGATDGR